MRVDVSCFIFYENSEEIDMESTIKRVCRYYKDVIRTEGYYLAVEERGKIIAIVPCQTVAELFAESRKFRLNDDGECVFALSHKFVPEGEVVEFPKYGAVFTVDFYPKERHAFAAEFEV